MDFKTMFAKELAEGKTTEDILYSLADAANVYEREVAEERKRAEQEKKTVADQYAKEKHEAAEHVVTELLAFLKKYTNLGVDVNDGSIVTKFLELLDGVECYKLW